MRALMLATIATLSLSLPAFAESDPATAVDTLFEASQARLKADGYRGIRMLKGDPNRVSAWDEQGSRVVLTLNPHTGDVDGSEYVHPMDE